MKKWFISWDKHLISEHFVAEGKKINFSWDFNTPKASHMNGSIESLIRSCRKLSMLQLITYSARTHSLNGRQLLLNLIILLILDHCFQILLKT